ncbi:MAG TPA: hypothetical protein VGM44_15500 [Polyangiaceae bacterium]|jgi:hypothetical protein
MSIAPTNSYMSNLDIISWMETKTDDQYDNMKSAMSVADNRSDCEAALNQIKSDIANAANDGADAKAIHDEVNAALQKYRDIPGVSDVLQPIANKLNDGYGTSEPVNITAEAPTWGSTSTTPPPTAVPNVQISSDDSKTWSANITSTVQDLGNQDQLGMINIQEYNNEINQTKQIASALIDSANKSSQDIISHVG